MSTHKLADGPITMTVADVDVVDSERFPGTFQYKFTSTDGVSVYLNKAPADRQLERLKLDGESAIGQTLRFEQVEKNGTKFNNIDRARAGDATGPSAPAGRPATAPIAPAPKMTVGEAVALYQQALAGVYGPLGDACAELGVPVTADALQAAAATVFIAAKGK